MQKELLAQGFKMNNVHVWMWCPDFCEAIREQREISRHSPPDVLHEKIRVRNRFDLNLEENLE